MLVGRTCTQISDPPTRSQQQRNPPVAVVDPCLCAKQLLLPSLVGEVPSHLVAVLLSLQRRNEVYPRPHLLAREFAASSRQRFHPYVERTRLLRVPQPSQLPRNKRVQNVLVLPDSLSNPPESVCHEYAGAEQVDGGSEAANGEVALVLDGVVPAHGGHILRHCGRSGSRGGLSFNWVGGVPLAGCGDDVRS